MEIVVEDRKEVYLYRVVSQTYNGNTVYYSNDVPLELPTGIWEYCYIIDSSPNTVITMDMEKVVGKSTTGQIEGIVNGDVYIHAVAIDISGKISDTAHLYMKEDPTHIHEIEYIYRVKRIYRIEHIF